MFKKYFFIILIIPAITCAQSTGFRNIKGFGCHKNDGTCFVNVDGDPVNVAGCTSNSIRWNSLSDPGGRSWMTLIALAISLNRRVIFELSGCYSNQIIFPTFSYGVIE
jgi:hypothetical protein